jgi:hypothetical protein
MADLPVYTTLARVKAQLGITDTDDDVLITRAIAAASRSIDRWTGTTFYPVTEARSFAACGNEVWVDRFTSTVGLVVKTGTDGTFPTTVAASSYVLQPLNAPSYGRAYDRIMFPRGGIVAWPDGFPNVQITASWGWAEPPDDVEQAARIKAAALFRRKDSPEGVAGTSEFGVLRISGDEDPTVALLLRPYTDWGIA